MKLIKTQGRAADYRPLAFTKDPTPISHDVAPALRAAPAEAEGLACAAQEMAFPAANLAQIEKSAYESGFRQGEKAGREIAEKQVDAMMRRYAEAVSELGKLKSGLYSQVEREVVKLALEVARKIVRREVRADGEIIQTLVRVALDHVAVKSAVKIHLHPVDYNFLLAHRAELLQGGRDTEAVLVADKSIERGGCLIESECGDIDARIEEEFREVERTFFTGEE